MSKVKIFTLVLFISLLSACVTIPQESVDLSSQVGVGIKKQHQYQVDLVNLHFAIKRKSLDEAMEKALNKYFEILTPSGTITLNRNQLGDVATDVMNLSSKNNAAKEELEKARVLIIKQLSKNYLTLNQANSSVTGLLQSAVTVKGARSEALQSLSNATGGKVDLDEVFKELDAFILKGGEEAGKTIKLVDKIKTLFSGGTDKEEIKE